MVVWLWMGMERVDPALVGGEGNMLGAARGLGGADRGILEVPHKFWSVAPHAWSPQGMD